MELRSLTITCFFFTLIIFSANNVVAQQKLNFSFGLSMSKQTISNPQVGSVRLSDSWEHHSNSTLINGISVGFGYVKFLNEKIQIEAEMLYTQKGQIEEVINEAPNNSFYPSYKETYRINYLNFPINIKILIDKEDDFDFFLLGGVYLGSGVGGKTTNERLKYCYQGNCNGFGSQTYSSEEGTLEFSSSITDLSYNFNNTVVMPFDFGLTIGTGLIISKVEIFGNYQIGMVDVHTKIGNDMNGFERQFNNRIKKNRSFIFGIKFRLKKLSN